MALVLGRDIAMNVVFPEGKSTIVCARNMMLDIQTSILPTTTVGSGSWESSIGNKHSWGATCDGVINVGAGYGYHLLRRAQIAKTPITIEFVITSTRGASLKYTGDALIISSQSGGGYNDAGTFYLSLKGVGELTETLIIDSDCYLTDDDGTPLEDWDGSFLFDASCGSDILGDFVSSDFSSLDFLT